MDPLHALAELLAPARCPTCGVRAAPPWCAACDRDTPRVVPQVACGRCGLPGGEPGDGHPCWVDGVAVDRSVVAYAYRGPVADAIVAGKAGGVTTVWRPLGQRLGAQVQAAGIVAAAVVPVPTDPRRRRMRGVDHARLLADEVGGALGRPVRDVLRVAPGLVDQGTRPLAERGSLPIGAITVAGRVPPVPVLVVDDVLTTGATALAAAAALRRGGARGVAVAAVARAGRHRLGAGSRTARG